LRPVLTSARHVVDCVRDGDGVQREEDVMNLRGGAGRATSTSAGVQGVQRISSDMWAPRRAARETNEKRSARARASVGSGRVGRRSSRVGGGTSPNRSSARE
jgi:hypothetical protein